MTRRPPAIPSTVDGLAVDDYPPIEPGLPPVLVVHGAMDRAGGFRRLVRHLPRCRVVTFDRRGYSRSIGEPCATLDDAVRDLAAVRAVLGDSPVLVFGHSQGGLIALRAAADGVLGDADALAVYEPPMPWHDWYLAELGDRLLLRPPDEVAERFLRGVLGDAVWERLPPSIRAARCGDGAALLADLRASRARGAEPRWNDIHLSVTALRGECSVPHNRRTVDELVARLGAVAAVEVPAADHGAHISQPAALARCLLDAQPPS